ncbi:MAG TPA: WecB/TagA/CpsF family glycosyltransferase [Bauldia sp.]|nr:WecB/TagA/CpsF family glycosyltransferase [Bauldia sp.]
MIRMAVSGPRVDVVGHAFDALTMDETVDLCVGWCRAGSAPHIVMPINAAIVVAMRNDPALRAAGDAADLRMADGTAILWAARLAGVRLPERVTGIDLMQRLIERAAADGLSAFLLGARRPVIDRLVEVYRARYPNLRIAGFQDGYFDKDEHASLIERIRASGADLLFIGMPTPFKETWAQQHRDRLGVPVILGVGGSFDVLAGFIPRAPRILQRAGLEWLWRLVCEPRRLWKRYLVGNAAFIGIAIAAAARRRRNTAATQNAKRS